MHVVVNAAISADGKLSTRRREQIELSGEDDWERVADMRAEADAVMVGIGTVQADDPRLVLDETRRHDRREEGRTPNPARVVADSQARIPPDARVLDNAGPTYVLVSETAPRGRKKRLQTVDATVITAGSDRVDLAAALRELEADGIDHLMVEGGGEIIFSLFAAGVVDELSTFVAPTVIGGSEAPTLADGRGFVGDFPDLALQSVERLDDGAFLEWTVETDDE